jgi:hypothetical protein
MIQLESAGLLEKASQLATLGVEIEAHRSKLRLLANQGVSFRAPKMIVTLEAFERAEASWNVLKADCKELRKEVKVRVVK